jgi:serine protease
MQPARLRRRRRKASCRLHLESLEVRRVLTAAGDFTPQLETLSDYEADSLIVQFKSGTSSASSLAAYLAGSALGEAWDIVPGLRQVHLNEGTSVEAALAAYSSDANVVFAEPNYRVKLNFVPNDPSFADQYALRNTGQNGAVPGADIHVTEAWELTTGNPAITVAVIDTGIDYRHPDLAPNMWVNPGEVQNGLDDDLNGYIDDIYGYDFADNDGDPMDDHYHGTHVAGTIGAVMDNEIGIAGVANVKLMALKIFNEGGLALTSDAINALNYAVENGALISNNSWGGDGFSQAFQEAIAHSATAGHIFVAAAGNFGMNTDTTPFYPASYEGSNIVSVAATDIGDHIAWFSNFGKTSVDLAAPGADILSTLPTQQTFGMTNEGLTTDYGTRSGTSMAAPHVSGVLALVKAQNPNWTSQQIIQQVLSSVDLQPSLTTRTVTGGRLNAARALGIIPPDTTPPRIVDSDPTGAVAGPIDHLRLTFSESIDANSLDINDVLSFNGPEGPIFSAFSVTPVDGREREYDIWFDPQTLPGDYSLLISPHISDPAGLELDQDNNGIGGVDGSDEYLVSFEIYDTSPQIISSFEVPLAITGFDIFASLLTIDEELRPIADLNVQLNLSYPSLGSLEVWLVSPAGTRVTLSYRHGGENADFQDTIFDDEAEISIGDGEAPFAASFRPDDSLAVLDDEDPRGTWTLFIHNVSETPQDGMLNSWSLEILQEDPPGDPGPDPDPDPDPDENDPPTARDDTVNGVQNTPRLIFPHQLLVNDNDPNGDDLAIVGVLDLVGGHAELNADDTIVFTPEPDRLTPASFQYQVSDGLVTVVATVTVLLRPQFPFHNGLDVDNDGFATPNDALVVINWLNQLGPTPIAGLGSGVAAAKPFYDVLPDNFITSGDALEVINFINAFGSQQLGLSSQAVEGEAHGSARTPLVAAAVDQCLTAEGEEALVSDYLQPAKKRRTS